MAYIQMYFTVNNLQNLLNSITYTSSIMDAFELAISTGKNKVLM